MIDALQAFDDRVFAWINQGWVHPWLDAFFPFVTDKDNFLVPVVIAAVLLLWRGGRYGFGQAKAQFLNSRVDAS